MFSVIIPSYNSAPTIKKVLGALYNQRDIDTKEYEVIVVNDGSFDSSVNLIKEFPIHLITLEKKSGPANARNQGANAAKEDILIFIDSDVILKENALSQIKKRFAQNPDIVALSGIYAKEPANPGPFHDYLALRKYSNWFDPMSEFMSFLAVSLGAIKKDKFLEFGGFDTKYRGADVEDFELGYRITQKYKILLATEIQGYHYFPSFTKTVKNFFKRSFQWMRLFAKRKRFSTEAATTGKRAIANLAGFISLITALFTMIYPTFLILSLTSFLIFLWVNIKFYSFVWKEKGFLFSLYAFFIDYILAVIVGIAAILSILNQCRLNVMRR